MFKEIIHCIFNLFALTLNERFHNLSAKNIHEQFHQILHNKGQNITIIHILYISFTWGNGYLYYVSIFSGENLEQPKVHRSNKI